jgi:quercetin dioxygenase-like cupin family protein
VALMAVIAPLTSRGADRPDPQARSVTLPDEIRWRKGATADTAIIQGDPAKPGLYIQLIRWHPGSGTRPHSHPDDRYVWVLSGTWWVGSGTKYDPDAAYPVKAGTFIVDHANEIHWDLAKDEDCVVYIVGIGPTKTVQAGNK